MDIYNTSSQNVSNDSWHESAGLLDNADLTKPLYMTVVVTLAYGIIFLCGFVGNAMVLVVVWRNKTMHSSTNMYLVNLGVADLLVIVVCMPAGLLEFFSDEVWYLGAAMCKCTCVLLLLKALFTAMCNAQSGFYCLPLA